jgi:lipoprotein-anchoring transpeptidase ErfK/SrfK
VTLISEPNNGDKDVPNDLPSIRTEPKCYPALRIALLTMTALTAVPVAAHAQFFWQNQMYDRPEYDAPPAVAPQASPPRHRPKKVSAGKNNLVAVKEATKPDGPVVIAISIDNQQMKIYDSNGLFAQTPVSTGMRGHSTPMGVFSVLGKEKYHRSNIYSGAPMPYMQRITWSGVAMHAGVLPGYPASHGCIRMPMNFAIRMYGWTRNGARVVIAPGDLSPVDFSHPLLFTRKPEPAQESAVPASVTTAQQSAPVSTPKSDKAAVVGSAAADPAVGAANIAAPSNSNAPVRTADASGSIPDLQPAKGDETKVSKDQTRQADAPSQQTADAKPADPVAPAADAKPSDAKASDAKPFDAKATSDAPAAKAEAPPKKRTGHIAVFISRKEGKIFVRQNFDPLFEAPVTIADGGPLGTHVFTMRADKADPKTYRWSVVTMPARNRADAATSRKKNPDVTSASIASSSPSDALDRITIPNDAMQKIAAVMVPGDSLVVSDLGLGGETGEGTDFIVQLR